MLLILTEHIVSVLSGYSPAQSDLSSLVSRLASNQNICPPSSWKSCPEGRRYISTAPGLLDSPATAMRVLLSSSTVKMVDETLVYNLLRVVWLCWRPGLHLGWIEWAECLHCKGRRACFTSFGGWKCLPETKEEGRRKQMLSRGVWKSKQAHPLFGGDSGHLYGIYHRSHEPIFLSLKKISSEMNVMKVNRYSYVHFVSQTPHMPLFQLQQWHL